MGTFKHLLENQEVIILDGALGTELESLGYDVTGKLWSAKYLLENPAIIRELHEVYLRAGSDLVTSASYQATVAGLMDVGLSEEDALAIIKQTIFLAKAAVENVWGQLSEEEKSTRPYPLVSGCVGPYAAYLADGSEYTGAYSLTLDQYKDFHRPRIQALLEAGADLLAIETIPNADEAQALIHLLAEEFTEAEAYISFVAQSSDRMADGTKIATVAKWCQESPQILAIGINCTAPHLFPSLLKEISEVSDKPLVTYPNSGEIYDGKTQTWYDDPDQSHTLVENSLQWKELGVKIFGGCCRTRPEDIEQLAKAFREKD